MEFGAPCGEPGQLALRVLGEGRATHLGLTGVELNLCWDAAAGHPVGEVDAVYTAADGDEVWMTADGTTFSMGATDYLVQGGTGRFDGATGLLHVTGTQYPGLTWTTDVTGWIAY